MVRNDGNFVGKKGYERGGSVRETLGSWIERPGLLRTPFHHIDYTSTMPCRVQTRVLENIGTLGNRIKWKKGYKLTHADPTEFVLAFLASHMAVIRERAKRKVT